MNVTLTETVRHKGDGTVEKLFRAEKGPLSATAETREEALRCLKLMVEIEELTSRAVITGREGGRS